MKILKPSFFKDQKKRIKFRYKALKRSGVENPIEMDSLSELCLSPIEVGSSKTNLAWFLGATNVHRVGSLLFETMNKKDKTVTITIHLDRQEKEIIQDIKFILTRIKQVARLRGVDLSSLKHHRNAFDKCFRVYDLKQRGKKWREIAKAVCGDNVDPDSAKGIVRSLWRKADQMIKEGGRRI